MENNNIQKVFNIFNDIKLRDQQIILRMLNSCYLRNITVGDVREDKNIEESIHYIMLTDTLLGRSLDNEKK